MKRVVIAGGGIGSAEHTTKGVIEALKCCDVCLYDALCPNELLHYLPPDAESVYVGKRSGKHAYSQGAICRLLTDYAVRGKRVVRLKGGDPGIFGRLTEETAALDDRQLPYTVLPGISSMTMATTATGLLLTRRGVNRGFVAAAPRRSGSAEVDWFTSEETAAFTRVLFMGAGAVGTVAARMLQDGLPKDTPISVVYSAGCADCRIISGSLNDISEKVTAGGAPGIIIVGRTADPGFLYPRHGVLSGQKILFAGSSNLADKAVKLIKDYDGIPLIMPMIELVPVENIAEKLSQTEGADWLVIPSPAAAEILFSAAVEHKFDLRKFPEIAVSGPETGAVVSEYHIFPEVVPRYNYGSRGIIRELLPRLRKGERVVRICSNLAGSRLSRELMTGGAEVKDLQLYRNIEMKYENSTLPDFDAVIFTSPSAVKALTGNFDTSVLSGKKICVIGKPTMNSLAASVSEYSLLIPEEASLKSLVFRLAAERCMELIGRRRRAETRRN